MDVKLVGDDDETVNAVFTIVDGNEVVMVVPVMSVIVVPTGNAGEKIDCPTATPVKIEELMAVMVTGFEITIDEPLIDTTVVLAGIPAPTTTWPTETPTMFDVVEMVALAVVRFPVIVNALLIVFNPILTDPVIVEAPL